MQAKSGASSNIGEHSRKTIDPKSLGAAERHKLATFVPSANLHKMLKPAGIPSDGFALSATVIRGFDAGTSDGYCNAASGSFS